SAFVSSNLSRFGELFPRMVLPMRLLCKPDDWARRNICKINHKLRRMGRRGYKRSQVDLHRGSSEADGYEMMVSEPEESLYHRESFLGTPMTRQGVLSGTQKDGIFEVADFIACNDTAVRSYLCGQEIDRSGRGATVN